MRCWTAWRSNDNVDHQLLVHARRWYREPALLIQYMDEAPPHDAMCCEDGFEMGLARDGNGVATILSTTGTQQGDGLSAVLFCKTLHRPA